MSDEELEFKRFPVKTNVKGYEAVTGSTEAGIGLIKQAILGV